jgi:chromosome segregation ATPase
MQGLAGVHDSNVSGRKVKELEDVLSKERRQISELEHKYTLTLHQLDLATSREEQLRNEARELERNLALIKHELKEVRGSSFYSFQFHKILIETLMTTVAASV